MASGILTPSQIQLTGPQIQGVTYTLYGTNYITEISPAHAIMGNELSLTVAQYNGFASDSAITEGSTAGFNDQGVYFNMVRPVVNNTDFRIGLYYLFNYTYFQDVMLSGVEGTAVPTVFPCSLYAVMCKNNKGSPAEDLWGPTNLLNAIKYFKLTESDPNPIDRIFEGNTSDITCPSNPAVNGCPNLTWHQGSATGPIYAPNWVGRVSLHRHDYAVYVQGEAAKIGFTFAYTEFVPHSQSTKYVEEVVDPSVVKDGVYNAKTGANSAPVFDYARSSPSACSSGISTTNNCWDMYSYGFGVPSATSGLFSGAESYNSAYLNSEINVGLFVNKAYDLASNKVIYAKTVAAATSAGGAMGLIWMQQLPWINVFFENIIWAAVTGPGMGSTSGWSGYAAVPTQGPMSSTGLDYTLLNLHQNCYPSTCENGGTPTFGVESNIDYPGGPTPAAWFNSVYDVDMYSNIYDTPTVVGPTQFTSPGVYQTWMLSYNGKPVTDQLSSLQIKVKPFTGMTGSGAGWTDYQKNVTDVQLSNAAQKIVKGQEIILEFAPNIYFSDHVQMTAADYNFSLYYGEIASSPTYPNAATNTAGLLPGPSGLIAGFLPSNDPLQIDLYVNSTSLLNPLYAADAYVVPLHIWKYFNLNNALSLSSTIDTSFNFNGTIQAANGCVSCLATNQGIGKASYPAWLYGLPNLEIGTGPFILRSWDGVGQTGLLLRNPTYYRTDWSQNDTNNQVTLKQPFTFKQTVAEWTYSPTACASSPDKVCQVPITSLTSATLQLLNSKTGAVLKTFSLTCSKGVCSGSIPTTSGFKVGDNELAFSASYTYLGLARTWYQLTGVLVHH